MNGFVIAILLCTGSNCDLTQAEPGVSYETYAQCSTALSSRSAQLQAMAAKRSPGSQPAQVVCIHSSETIADADAPYDVLETTVAHKEPDFSSPFVGVAEKGQRTLVTGLVSGTNWVRVLLADGTTGFVIADRLRKVAAPPHGNAEAGTAPPARSPPAQVAGLPPPRTPPPVAAPPAAAPPAPTPLGTPDTSEVVAAAKPQAQSPRAQLAASRPPITAPAPSGGRGEFRDCPTCPVMVPLGTGSFEMGSNEDPTERPPHRVTIHPFAIGKFEVTAAEWQACLTGGGCTYRPPPADGPPDRRPIGNLSWTDATEYVRWLRQATGKPYRLPSEAEWEYAAAAGTASRFGWGEQPGINHADCKGCTAAHDDIRPADTDAFTPNAWGLHAMEGGVAEWVEDCWHVSYRGAPADGEAWRAPNCARHVLRGGSWMNPPGDITVRVRNFYDTGVRYEANGLRVALTLR
jgi:formylglycine-generating enzyme required for sulfatase activity